MHVQFIMSNYQNFFIHLADMLNLSCNPFEAQTSHLMLIRPQRVIAFLLISSLLTVWIHPVKL